jgi:hypothetical protein
MGGYEVCKTQLGATDPATTPLWKKIVAGGIAGATGAAIANPTDLVKGMCPVFRVVSCRVVSCRVQR